MQFSGFLNTEFAIAKKALDASTPSSLDSSTPAISSNQSNEDDGIDVITEEDDHIRLNVKSLELRIYIKLNKGLASIMHDTRATK